MRSANGRARSANSLSPWLARLFAQRLWRLRQRFRNAAVSSGVPNIMVGVETSRHEQRDVVVVAERFATATVAASTRAESSDGQQGASSCICRQ